MNQHFKELLEAIEEKANKLRVSAKYQDPPHSLYAREKADLLDWVALAVVATLAKIEETP